MARLNTVGSVVAAAAMLAVPLLAQKPQFRSSTDTVQVHATVKLRNGTVAHDLTREDFELFEDGKLREITVFSKSVQPLSVALVLDRSGSTDPDAEGVRTAAQEFVARLLRTDRAAISTLFWDCQPFTNDPRDLQSFLRMALPRDSGSPIWSATDRAMTALASEGGRRVVLLLSDGDDNQRPPPPDGLSSAYAPSAGFISPCVYVAPGDMRDAGDIAERAEREAIMVYTVSVGPGAQRGTLANLAKRTGASHQPLAHESDIRAAFISIADELHLQYVLGFTPAFDGKRHEIQVKVKRSGVTVRARQAYVAAKPAK